jgi:hypothetical protein
MNEIHAVSRSPANDITADGITANDKKIPLRH